jgi:hypothetical protein
MNRKNIAEQYGSGIENVLFIIIVTKESRLPQELNVNAKERTEIESEITKNMGGKRKIYTFQGNDKTLRNLDGGESITISHLRTLEFYNNKDNVKSDINKNAVDEITTKIAPSNIDYYAHFYLCKMTKSFFSGSKHTKGVMKLLLTQQLLAALTPKQIAALTPQQIAALTPQQLSIILIYLTSTQFNEIKGTDVETKLVEEFNKQLKEAKFSVTLDKKMLEHILTESVNITLFENRFRDINYRKKSLPELIVELLNETKPDTFNSYDIGLKRFLWLIYITFFYQSILPLKQNQDQRKHTLTPDSPQYRAFTDDYNSTTFKYLLTFLDFKNPTTDEFKEMLLMVPGKPYNIAQKYHTYQSKYLKYKQKYLELKKLMQV